MDTINFPSYGNMAARASRESHKCKYFWPYIRILINNCLFHVAFNLVFISTVMFSEEMFAKNHYDKSLLILLTTR